MNPKKMLNKKFALCFSLIIALIVQTVLCQASNQKMDSPQLSLLHGINKIQKVGRVIIYPLKNLSGNPDVPVERITSLLAKELNKKGLQIVPYVQLDKILTKMRVRNTDFIDKGTAVQLWNELAADVILLGSIDVYSKTGSEVFAGLTLRLVGSRDTSIIWANTLSYAGNDFTGLLGFGRLNTLDELCEAIIPRIIDGIPENYQVNVNAKGDNVNFVELLDVKMDPPIAGGGKIIKLKVGMVPLNGTLPALVRAQIDGEIIYLKYGEGNYFTGEFISPTTDGSFPLEIVAKAPGGYTSQFSSAGEVIVDMMPPLLEMDITKDVMRGWNHKDFILFNVKADEAVKKWEVEILNKENKFVRKGRGYNYLPARLIWRGENDLGFQNKDGAYNFRLSVWDAAGNVKIHNEVVKIDTIPPKVKISIKPNTEESERKDELIFSMDYSEEETMEKWDFSLYTHDSKLIKKISGTGNVGKTITVDAVSERKLNDGKRLIYAFKAVDKAGNTFETSNPVVFDKRIKQFFSKQQNGSAFSWVEDF